MDASHLEQHHLRTLSARYAQAVDRRDEASFKALFADDAVIEGPGFRLAGLAEIMGIPAMLRQNYRATRHLIHNQLFTFDGDQATGETYCTASHLLLEPKGESPQVLIWHLRYLDQYGKQRGPWIFKRREIAIDWTETRSVAPLG